ncbi:ATP-binding protein [Cupriavidus plantarum]|uniref:ATP-binding protein n=1 Tax=Cupriavidus plantarum TaxID=942865 RepID=UPI00142D5CF9|nr:ATP-binding protein [Cupriavidus plantarum]
MYLVNAGTNKQKPSRRISEVDPRGGAAVVGPNGVGKTTTLRLAPLFLGHLPSQIIQAGHGQKSMARFILPTPESAIVFEYQRGASETHDVRLAVLRARRDNPDAIEYRLFECGFSRALFVGVNGPFLDDEGTTAAAREAGFSFTPKLTTIEYRTIILNLRGNTKDAQKLRTLARSYSFAPRAMPNLDRLVASVVKEHVSFSDLIQVAVSMVHEETGVNGPAGGNKLQLKQTKSEINDWIRNRRACERALNQSEKVAQIRESLAKYWKEEHEMRLLGAEVHALHATKTVQLGSAADARTDAESIRVQRIHEEQRQHEELSTALDTVQGAQRTANTAYQNEAYTRKQFEDERVEHWATRQGEVPRLKAKREKLINEQKLYVARFSETKAAIDEEIHTARERLVATRDKAVGDVEALAEETKQRYEVASQVIVEQKEKALYAARLRHSTRQSELAEELMALGEARAGAKIHLESVEGPAELREAVAQLHDELTAANEALQGAMGKESQCQRDLADTRVDSERIERELGRAKSEAADVLRQIQSLEQRLSPDDGTLMAALRKRPRHDWEALAKVVDPSLLTRNDLRPSFDADADPFVILGWSFDLEKIVLPSWADEEEMRRRLGAAQQRYSAAQQLIADWRTRQETAVKLVSAADEQLRVAKAEVSVAGRNKTNRSESLERAQNALSMARQKDHDKWHSEVKRLNAAIESTRGKQSEHVRHADAELKAVTKRFDDQIWAMGVEHKKEVGGYKASIDEIRVRAQADLTSLENQRRLKLKEANIDPDKIKSWEEQRAEIDGALEAIQDKVPLVARWRDWMNANGPLNLIRLQEALDSANTALSQATQAMQAHEAACRATEKAYMSERAALDKTIDALTDECRKLRPLCDELPRHASSQVSIQLDMSATEMIATVDVARHRLHETKRHVGQLFNAVRNALTAHESDVKDFVEKSLSEIVSGDGIDQANALAMCHQKIPTEIVSNLNNTLRAILDTIEYFYGAILGFETEIKRFNKRLAEGLHEVEHFERVKGLQIEMVTDFSTLGFVERLEAVSRYAANTHVTLGRVSTRTEVPDVQAEIVLQEFANALSSGGRIDVDLSSHIRIQGRVFENEIEKIFQRESELENVSSNGLTSIILITLLIGMLNMIRGKDELYITWVTDEVGKFDGPNFVALMDMLRDNYIDVITASPDLNPRHYRRFAQRYRFEDMGVIRMFAPQSQTSAHAPAAAGAGAGASAGDISEEAVL